MVKMAGLASVFLFWASLHSTAAPGYRTALLLKVDEALAAKNVYPILLKGPNKARASHRNVYEDVAGHLGELNLVC